MYQSAPIFIAALLVAVKANGKTVTTSGELQAALDSAQPGDIINLASGTFTGPFTISTSGTQSAPIILTTNANRIKITGSGVGFMIGGSYWTVKYLPISDFDTGVILKGNSIVLESLAIIAASTGVSVQGHGNTVQNCAIEASQVGIRVSGDNTVLESNSVRGSNPAIVADKGTCCGRFQWNALTGKVKVEGENYRFDGNSIIEEETPGKPGTKEPSSSFLSSFVSFFRNFFG